MQREERRSGQGRRGFLKLAGLGAVVGTVAAATGTKPAQALAAEGDRGAGYRLTEHVKKAYALARF